MVTQEKITNTDVVRAFERICVELLAQSEYLTSLDQAMGDGDLGINLSRMALALQKYLSISDSKDLGKFLMSAGIETNKAAPSTMGTLLATALLRAGKTAQGLSELSGEELANILEVALLSIKERGKANLGDKTILDVLHPAVEAFSPAVKTGLPLSQAASQMLAAAIEGRDRMISSRSKIGRASWIGERTEGQIDPGSEALVVILKAAIGKI